jgi:ABC-type bacteriocin/lantibiotic exporter with double-glycine peptidase domain
MTGFLMVLLTASLLSEEELRFSYMYKQGADTSCGIAVTASVLNHYWNIPVTETELYQVMIVDSPDGGEANYTVSFKRVSDCLAQYGVQSKAYKMNWDELTDTLSKDYAPIIIHYSDPTPHFALLLEIKDSYAFVADPARGFSFVNKSTFEKQYSGNALLTASRSAVKNTERIAEISQKEATRLARLNDLARIGGRR